jgi:hypothetical protein
MYKSVYRFHIFGPSDIGMGVSKFARLLGPDFAPSLAMGMNFINFSTMDPLQDADWDGGHNPSVNAVQYAFKNFIVEPIKQQHPDWSLSQVEEAAYVELDLRRAKDARLYQGELDREPEMTTEWDVVETSPGRYELATEYGGGKITLRELWEHTREYADAIGKPWAYSEEEAKAQLDAQDALIKGEAASFMSFLSHPDGIRYATVMERNPDGSIKSKIVDIALTVGHDLSEKEATEFVAHMADYYKESKKGEAVRTGSDYPHFMMTHGSIEVRDVRVLAKEQFYNSPPSYRANETSRPVYDQPDATSLISEMAVDTTRHMVRDVTETVDGVKKYLVSKLQKPQKEENTEPEVRDHDRTPIFLQILQGKIHDFFPSIIDTLVIKKTEKLSGDQKNENTTIHSHKAKIQEDNSEATGKGNLPQEKSEKTRIELQQEWLMTQNALVSMVFSSETAVGIGGALTILESLALFEFTSMESDEKNETDNKEKMNLEFFKEEDGEIVVCADAFKRIITLLSVNYSEDSSAEETEASQSVKPETVNVRDSVVAIWLTEYIESLDQRTPENAMLLVEEEEERVADKYRLLSEILEEFFGEKEKQTDIRTNGDRKNTVTEIEQETLREFSIAVTFWMMLKFASYYQSLRSLKNALADVVQILNNTTSGKNNGKEISSVVASRLAENLTQPDGTEGVLAAIIWKLAQIREQGMRTKTQPAKKAKKSAKQRFTLPLYDFDNQGVIYAYGS